MLTQKTTKGNYYSTQLSPAFLYSHLFKMQTNSPCPDLFSPISECQTLRELLPVKSLESVETEKLDIWHFNTLKQVISLFN